MKKTLIVMMLVAVFCSTVFADEYLNIEPSETGGLNVGFGANVGKASLATIVVNGEHVAIVVPYNAKKIGKHHGVTFHEGKNQSIEGSFEVTDKLRPVNTLQVRSLVGKVFKEYHFETPDIFTRWQGTSCQKNYYGITVSRLELVFVPLFGNKMPKAPTYYITVKAINGSEVTKEGKISIIDVIGENKMYRAEIEFSDYENSILKGDRRVEIMIDDAYNLTGLSSSVEIEFFQCK